MNFELFAEEFKENEGITIDITKEIPINDYELFIEYLNKYYVYSRYSYFITFIRHNIKMTPDEKFYYLDIENANIYEIFSSDSSVIAYFYDLLNIYCKYMYLTLEDNGNISYYESTASREEQEEDIPEIIVLEYNNTDIKLNYTEFIRKVENEIIIKDENMGIIIYKKNKYKLDYITHFNNTNIRCDKRGNCVHCISAITYNNEEYIYDSGKTRETIVCDKTKYKVPCSLIKQKWSKNVNKEITYCTTNCNYNLDCKLDNIYRNDICYTFNYNLIYVYVLI
jgi:hypothetical protein